MPTATFSPTIQITNARPAAFPLPVGRTALVIVDMQRDFVLPQGYGAVQCPSPEIFAQVASLIGPCLTALRSARKLGMTIVHTREGHPPDLSDCPQTKLDRQLNANKRHVLCIGDEGPMGRLLVQGSYGHDIVDELTPRKDEIILDKPGKGSFYNTDLHEILVSRGVTHILVCGVTAECCVATTFREANDHGFESCVLTDCTGGFNGSIVSATLDMFCAYDGLLGYATTSTELAAIADLVEPGALALKEPTPTSRLEIKSLHDSYMSGSLIVSEVISRVYEMFDESRFERLIPVEDNLGITAKLDDDKSVDVDGVKDISPLFGVPFATTAEFNPSAVIIKQATSIGAVYIGETVSLDTAIALIDAGAISFAFTSMPPPISLPGSVIAYTTTKGSLASFGVSLPSPSTSSITILSSTVFDARTIWSTLVRIKNPEVEPYYQKFSQRPIISIDYRGFEHGGIRYAVPSITELSKLLSSDDAASEFENMVKKIFTQKLSGRLIETAPVAETLFSASVLAAQECSMLSIETGMSKGSGNSIAATELIINNQALEALYAKTIAMFNSGIDSPDVVIVPLAAKETQDKEVFVRAIQALKLPALAIDNLLYVCQTGADVRILDLGVIIQMD
ncbi:Isochorismatase-like protein [Dipodascopsis uninucleata]